MPPVFEQPGGRGGGGGGGDYSRLAAALQSRYASDAATQARSELGFAELDQRRELGRMEMELGAARLRLQPILQEQQARLEIDNWMTKQQFNQRDQAELNRQQSLLSELMDKRAKGEISDPEFYAEARRVAPLVNVLQAKESYSKNAAMNEQRKALAEQNRLTAEMRAQQVKFASDTFEDHRRFVLDETQRERIAQEVRTLNPLLEKSNPGEFEEEIRRRGELQGAGAWWLQSKPGVWEPMKPEKTAGSASSGRAAAQAAPKPFNEPAAKRAAEALAELEGLDKETPEYTAKVKEFFDQKRAEHQAGVAAYQAGTPEGKAKIVEETKADRLGKIEALAAGLEGRDDLSPDKKQAANYLLSFMQRFVQQHGIPAPGTDLRKHLDKIADDYKKIVGDVVMPSRGQKTEQPPPEPSLGQRFLEGLGTILQQGATPGGPGGGGGY